MDITILNDAGLRDLVKKTLQFKEGEVPGPHDRGDDHKRFDMSGYGENNSCHVHNTNILNLFADCGIYDRVQFLYLDAYKGTITVYYQWWNEVGPVKEIDYAGSGTTDILVDMLRFFNNPNKKLRRFN